MVKERTATEAFGRRELEENFRQKDEIIRTEFKVIPCRIKKSWITAIGLDGREDSQVTVVTKKAIFPDPKMVFVGIYLT